MTLVYGAVKNNNSFVRRHLPITSVVPFWLNRYPCKLIIWKLNGHLGLHGLQLSTVPIDLTCSTNNAIQDWILNASVRSPALLALGATSSFVVNNSTTAASLDYFSPLPRNLMHRRHAQHQGFWLIDWLPQTYNRHGGSVCVYVWVFYMSCMYCNKVCMHIVQHGVCAVCDSYVQLGLQPYAKHRSPRSLTTPSTFFSPTSRR